MFIIELATREIFNEMRILKRVQPVHQVFEENESDLNERRLSTYTQANLR